MLAPSAGTAPDDVPPAFALLRLIPVATPETLQRDRRDAEEAAAAIDAKNAVRAQSMLEAETIYEEMMRRLPTRVRAHRQ